MSPAADPMGDLLGLGDLLGGATAAPPPPSAAPPPQMQLQPSPQLSPAQFQQLWEALPAAASFRSALQPSAVSATQTNHLVWIWLCELPFTCSESQLFWQGRACICDGHRVSAQANQSARVVVQSSQPCSVQLGEG